MVEAGRGKQENMLINGLLAGFPGDVGIEEGTALRSRGRGDVMHVPNEANASGVRGLSEMVSDLESLRVGSAMADQAVNG